MSVPHRCRCGHRRSIPNAQFQRLVNPPKCLHCRAPLRLDRYRQKVEKKRPACCCGAYPFPHRDASLYCVNGPAGVSFYDRRFYDRETRSAVA